jgi:plasmid stabilization system protein ParE
MTTRYVLAPEAALDLVEIWQYIKERAGVTVADKVESTILERLASWQELPVPATTVGISPART